MLKTKYILPVFAMVLLLGLSNSAFAQLTCSVASTPVTTDTETGLTEPAGDLIFNCISGGTATTAATLTVNFGVPITSTIAYPVMKPIAIGNVNGCSGAPTINSVSNLTGQVVLAIPVQSADCSWTLSGVLLAISGNKAANQSIVATVSVSPGNLVLIQAGQNTATVVNNILPGIKTPVVLTAGPGTALTNTSAVLPTFSIAVQENYIDMFRSAAQFNPLGATTTASNSTQLLFTFANIPAAVTLGGCAATVTSVPAGTTATASVSAASVTAALPTILVDITADTLLGATETITLTCTSFTVTAGTTSVPTAAITATVSLAPAGTAFSATNAVLTDTTTTGKDPRYASNPLNVGTVFNIISSTTHMLFPYVSVGGGFDTGFVIANTTTDPYGPTVAAGGARPLSGGVTLVFYPVTGAAFCVTTLPAASTAIPVVSGIATCTSLDSTTTPSKSGQGLAAGGVVNTGTSWVVLASEIMKQITGAPAVFNGYVFGIANFSNGHPTVFVADAAFSGKFTAGGPALVLANPAITPRFVTTGFETLGH